MILNYKKFLESSDYDDLERLLKELSDKTMSFKKSLIKNITPKDIYEDYFLDFSENEGFKLNIYNQSNILIRVELSKKLINPSNIEPLTNKYLRKSSLIVKRLESEFPDSKIHFEILLNDKSQSIQNGFDRKNDILHYTGIGDYKEDGVVNIKIKFFIA